MAAPILAAAKHELMIPIKNTARWSLMEEIKYYMRQAYGNVNPASYLTIMASSGAISFKTPTPGLPGYGLITRDDQWAYSDVIKNAIPQWAVGRIS